jgi:hypothetical protein
MFASFSWLFLIFTILGLRPVLRVEHLNIALGNYELLDVNGMHACNLDQSPSSTSGFQILLWLLRVSPNPSRIRFAGWQFANGVFFDTADAIESRRQSNVDDVDKSLSRCQTELPSPSHASPPALCVVRIIVDLARLQTSEGP